MPPRIPMVLEGVVMMMGSLADRSADQPEHAAAGIDGEIAVVAGGIVDETVDDHACVGPDRERAAVEKHQVRAVRGGSGDELVGLDVDADAQDAFVLVGRLAQGSPSEAEVTPTGVRASPVAADNARTSPHRAARRSRLVFASLMVTPGRSSEPPADTEHEAVVRELVVGNAGAAHETAGGKAEGRARRRTARQARG